MDNSPFDMNMLPLPEPSSHLRDEQSCPEQQEVDGIFTMYQLTPQERRMMLMGVVSDITSHIVQEHVARVQAEVETLEKWMELPEPRSAE